MREQYYTVSDAIKQAQIAIEILVGHSFDLIIPEAIAANKEKTVMVYSLPRKPDQNDITDRAIALLIGVVDVAASMKADDFNTEAQDFVNRVQEIIDDIENFDY